MFEVKSYSMIHTLESITRGKYMSKKTKSFKRTVKWCGSCLNVIFTSLNDVQMGVTCSIRVLEFFLLSYYLGKMIPRYH